MRGGGSHQATAHLHCVTGVRGDGKINLPSYTSLHAGPRLQGRRLNAFKQRGLTVQCPVPITLKTLPRCVLPPQFDIFPPQGPQLRQLGGYESPDRDSRPPPCWHRVGYLANRVPRLTGSVSAQISSNQTVTDSSAVQT